MKFLMTVQYYFPSLSGMQEFVGQIAERLASFGHDVTVATTYMPERTEYIRRGVRIVDFKVGGSTALGLTGEVERYREFLLGGNFDVVMNFAAQQWATDIALPILGEIKGRKVFIPVGFSGLGRPAYQDYFEKMKAWMKPYDLHIFQSDVYRDIQFARDNGIKPLVVIPGGASAEEFLQKPAVSFRKQFGIPQKNFLILHVGSHTGLKGHQDAFDMFRQARIRNATLVLAGSDEGVGCVRTCHKKARLFPFTHYRWLQGKRFLTPSLSREEMLAAYHEADLFLLPSNIECSPLVIYEAMASKTPFLTTDVGNTAELIEWSGGGRLLPTQKLPNGNSKAEVGSSARVLEEMVADRASREAMATAGFAAWERRFTWDYVARQYEMLSKKLVAGELGQATS